ncbi:MAG TPA: VanZ family protein [Chitinophagales bacterium]|nr:VanZ family protein [Chitinophagales bacterium]HNM31290.1 VanZ family protein [Chitinophagales bacterium]
MLYEYLPAVLWSAFIFFVCFIPGNDLPKENWLDKIHFDKIVHLSLYFILFLLIVRIPKKKNKKVFLFAALWCITQGVVIEFIQGTPLIKNRSFDVLDIAANVVGVIIALLWINTKHKTN